jgi:hypothetical protein
MDPLVKIRQHLGLPTLQELRRDYSTKQKELVPGTANWVLEQPTFLEWKKFTKPVLSLQGSPGCGKSSLSASIINHLLEIGDKNLLIGYYFFHNNDQNKQSMLKALSAMVYLAADASEEFSTLAAKTCQVTPNISAATIGSIWYDFIASRFGPNSNMRLCLVLDGVDEAIQDGIKEFVGLLAESLQTELRIQVLFVGRPEIENATSSLNDFSLETIVVSNKLNSNDITRFINDRYKKYLPKQNIRSLQARVTSILNEKANGMFLWVDLVYQELAKLKTAKQIEDHLSVLPAGLDRLYEIIFNRMEKNGSWVDEIKVLFCYLAHFNKPSVFLLNQILQFVKKGTSFDVETMITNTCISLISYEETGHSLFEKMIKPVSLEIPGAKQEGEIETAEEELDEEEMDEQQEEEEIINQQVEEDQRQRETMVKLCHASVSDYIKSEHLKTTNILYSLNDAKLNLAEMMLQMACAGATAPIDAWVYSMTNFCNQLEHLNGIEVSKENTAFIAEHIWEVFESEPLGKYISKQSSTYVGAPLQFESGGFSFGPNIQKNNNKNRQVLLKWIEKANSNPELLKPETRGWANKVLQNPLKLLAPLAETCIREWLNFDGDKYELLRRFQFASHCVSSVLFFVDMSEDVANLFSRPT